MERKRNQNSLRTLFGAEKIPGEDQIRDIADAIEPEELYGVRYISSKEIYCGHCLKTGKRNKAGKTESLCYHDIASAIVKPGSPAALPPLPEFIRNEDGTGKQDYGRNATKRWLQTRGGRYAPLKVTIPGDDLHAYRPVRAEIPEAAMGFLPARKDESRPRIAEQSANSLPETRERREWNGRNHLIYRYRRVNGIENRAEGERLAVNYLYFDIYINKISAR
ncbi:MAG: hypothetical protein Pg6C_11600 [Treponemataceae bacterium]|nr:MAG: hypothetical protein Pg6C_11600 [Treponemataceae bacterium]